MRRTLNRIVALLALPTVILATLWLSGEFRKLELHRGALTGVETISILWNELIGHDQLARQDEDTPIDHQSVISRLPPNGLGETQMAYLERALTSDNHERHVEGLLQAIVHAAAQSDMTAALSAEQKMLVDMLSDILPQSANRVRALTRQAAELAARSDLNDWDRLALTVAAGEMKTAVDHAARSRGLREALGAQSYEAIAPYAVELRRANADYQRVSAAFAIWTFRSEDEARQAPGAPMLSEHTTASDNLVAAVDAYWRLLATNLTDVLMHRQKKLELVLGLTAIVCLIFVAIAFGLALSLGRRLTSQTEKQMAQLSLFDPLTGLPNRRALKRELIECHSSNGDPAAITGMVCLDIKNFKAINGRFGESEGDSILRELSRALEHATAAEHMLARIGGDQFAVIVRRQLDSDQIGAGFASPVERVAKGLVELVHSTTWQGHESLGMSAYAGTAICDGSAKDSEELLRNAEMALRAAKLALSPGVKQFSTKMREEFDRDQLLAEQIEAAIGRGEIEAWFQPQIRLPDKDVVGFEALARWRCPKSGMILPSKFLPAASKAGLMPRIEMEIRRQAFSAMRQWLDAGLSVQHVGVNISAELLDEPTFAAQLFDELGAHGLRPDHVGIEILESVMVEGPSAATIRSNVEDLSRAGCHIELDDFGTGHAGLSSLRQLKVNQVKIDRSFVAGVHHEAELQKLTRALIELARSLHINVLAEGVELPAEQEWLFAHHCTAIQGFLISKPMPIHEVAVWMSNFADQPLHTGMANSKIVDARNSPELV